MTAQASAEELKQNATKEAQLILHEAELKARQLVNEAYTERQSIEQSMAKLKSAEQDFRFKFRQLLEGYLRQLGDAPEIEERRRLPPPPSSRATPRPSRRPSRASRRPAEPAKTAAAASAAPAAEPPAQPASPWSAEEPPCRAAATVPEARRSTPARGPGGVQAGAPRRTHGRPSGLRPLPPDPEVDADASARRRRRDAERSRRPRPSRPARSPAEPGAAAPPAKRERILFGESDDLLADVDSGVNENEFKW